MRIVGRLALLAWLNLGFASAQDAQLLYAETASVRALNFTQGNRASLQDARNDLSSAGWKQESRTQAGGASSTTYRAEVEVQLGGQPVKIEQLVQKTCGGANTVASCR